MPKFYCKWRNDTLSIESVGICSDYDLAEQETALNEVSTEIDRMYPPNALYVDPETFVIRRVSDDEQVSI